LTLNTVLRLLLLPVSTTESPNTITAGIVTLWGRLITAWAMQKWRRRREKSCRAAEEEEELFKGKDCISQKLVQGFSLKVEQEK